MCRYIRAEDWGICWSLVWSFCHIFWLGFEAAASEPGVKDSVGGTRYTGKKRTIVMTVILVWDEHTWHTFLNQNFINLRARNASSQLWIQIENCLLWFRPSSSESRDSHVICIMCFWRINFDALGLTTMRLRGIFGFRMFHWHPVRDTSVFVLPMLTPSPDWDGTIPKLLYPPMAPSGPIKYWCVQALFNPGLD